GRAGGGPGAAGAGGVVWGARPAAGGAREGGVGAAGRGRVADGGRARGVRCAACGRLAGGGAAASLARNVRRLIERGRRATGGRLRSEEHTSELQSRSDLVCRLLLEKKKKT